MSLLHVLTDGKVKIIKNFEKKDFDTIMQETFAIEKVYINMKDISKLNTGYFYIQIQIIFEVFAEKIDQLIHDKFYQFDFFEDEALIKTVRAISFQNLS